MRIRIGEGELTTFGKRTDRRAGVQRRINFPERAAFLADTGFPGWKAKSGSARVDREKDRTALSLGKNGRTSGHAGDGKRNVYGVYRSGVPGFF